MEWSRLQFASLLTYTPRELTTHDRREAKQFLYRLKQDGVRRGTQSTATQDVAARLRELLSGLPFAEWLGPAVALVPTPKSSLMEPGVLWVPQRLVAAMAREGLGYEAATGLERTIAVTKSSKHSRIDDRPTAAQHYSSLNVTPGLESPDEILVVDDVITTGATMLAACRCASEAFPAARVRAFAAERTISKPAEFKSILDPCVGTVTMRSNGRTRRVP